MTLRLILMALISAFIACICPALAATDQLAEGIQLYKAGKLADAVKSLSAFVSSHQTSPQNSTAYYYLACCYYQSGQTADAKRLYQTIVSSYPKSEEARTAEQMLARLQGGAVSSPTSARPGCSDHGAAGFGPGCRCRRRQR